MIFRILGSFKATRMLNLGTTKQVDGMMLLTYSTIRDKKSLHEVIYLSRSPPKWTQLLDAPNWFVHLIWWAY
jgi:hypothetical protein